MVYEINNITSYVYSWIVVKKTCLCAHISGVPLPSITIHNTTILKINLVFMAEEILISVTNLWIISLCPDANCEETLG